VKIVYASKFYYRRGGLEAYMFKATELLSEYNHQIIPFSTNYHKNKKSPYSKYFCTYRDLSKIRYTDLLDNYLSLKHMFFNKDAYQKVRSLCKVEKPKILQGFGMTKHLSGSVFKAAKDSGIKTVMRLSDYALLCPNSTALDGYGQICSNFNCYSQKDNKCIKRKCVQGSYLASIVGLIECRVNKWFDLYNKYVDHWIAPSRFIRDIFIKYYQIPPQKITYLPVFFNASKVKVSTVDDGYILYAGRLGREKGVKTLMRALKNNSFLPLKIAGAGPLEKELRYYVKKNNLNVEFLGFQTFSNLQKLIARASLVVVPSEWYENSPNITLEAYAHGKPVVGSDMGGIPELVVDGLTGYLFEPGNEEDLIKKIVQTLSKRKHLGLNGRIMLDQVLDPHSHYLRLINIYSNLLNN